MTLGPEQDWICTSIFAVVIIVGTITLSVIRKNAVGVMILLTALPALSAGCICPGLKLRSDRIRRQKLMQAWDS